MPLTMRAGAKVDAQVIVENNTGSVLQVTGCGSLFQVALGNDAIKPDVSWNACAQPLTVAVGESTYSVVVSASYLGCYGEGMFPLCTADGRPPPLPPGDYQAKLYQSPDVVPAPPPLAVQVTS